MTITNTTCRTSAVGSGVAGQEIPFYFPFTDTSDIVVKTRVTATGAETTLTETTDYAVNTYSYLSGNIWGGQVTLVDALAATSTVHILRRTDMTQELNLILGGPFNDEDVEKAFDKNTKLIIENNDALQRCLRTPDTDSVSAELPNETTRKGKYLYFDASTGAPSVASAVDADTYAVSTFMEPILANADGRTVRDDLGDTNTATYTIYKDAGIQMYHAQASPELDSTNYPDFENTDFVDLMTSVMGVLGGGAIGGAYEGTSYLQGQSVVAKPGGTYTLTKTWAIPPLQEMTLDFSKCNFWYDVATDDAITIDCCSTSTLKFGLINCTTTGKAVRILPTNQSRDAITVTGASQFEFLSIINSNGTGLCLDATATADSAIGFCKFTINEFNACNLALEILNPLGNPSLIDTNQFYFKGAACNCGIQVGQTAFSDHGGIHRNYFEGVFATKDGASDIGIECYAIRNVFNVVLYSASVSKKNIVFRSGASNNTVIGYLEDGYVDESGNSTNQIISNGSGTGATYAQLGGNLSIAGNLTISGTISGTTSPFINYNLLAYENASLFYENDALTYV